MTRSSSTAPRQASLTRRAGRAPAIHLAARAFAKVNLDLRVLGTRADGYHELRTVFQTIHVHDTLTAAAVDGPFSLSCTDPGVPVDARNLIWRAAAKLWSALGRGGEPRQAAVRLEKRIPVAAGLGGGSADAAATLVLLARLWGHAPPALLREVAADIGSDVPFFLAGGTALGLGRGEEIYPLVDLPRHWIVLVRPPFGVSTAEAYGWYDEDRAAGVRESPGELQVLPVPWPTRAAQMVNDLEPPVVRRHPELARIKAALKEAGAAAAAMSGSGSAVFGHFRSRPRAAAARAALARAGWEATLTRTVARDEHERLARPLRRRV